VVGAVHSLPGLKLATRLRPDELDVIEIRVDALANDLPALRRALPRCAAIPLLLTVRHPAEGGLHALSLARRRALIAEFLPHAALLDLELRSLPALAPLAAAAQAQGVGVVVSDHHFRRTPSLADLLARQRRAFAAGADVFKVATLTSTARDLARLLEFCARPAPGPRAVMGMGRFGPASRLALAQAGSVLNYGYLHTPNAPGQWEARELRRLLTQLA
jgi:3-dehydroquinate dehydratase-1